MAVPVSRLVLLCRVVDTAMRQDVLGGAATDDVSLRQTVTAWISRRIDT